MIYKTWGQIRAKVQRELDLEVEEFVQPEEFVEYVNDAVAVAESSIHKLGLEDEYFLTKYTLPLVTAQEDYSLPAPIYMNKIRNVIYAKGATIYEIPRLRSMNKFREIAQINQYNTSTDWYQYLIRNDSADSGVIMQLVPPARETSADSVKIWYIREAAKWTYDSAGLNDSKKCDLPQIAMQFLYQYVKYRCYEKEGHPNGAEAKADLGMIETKMIATMEQMVPDDNNEILRDTSSYDEMS